MTDSTFTGNNAQDYGGGAISNYGTCNVNNCTFTGNNAGYCGGAICNSGGTCNVTDSTFTGNTASNFGGAISNWSTACNVHFNRIVNNHAPDGSAICGDIDATNNWWGTNNPNWNNLLDLTYTSIPSSWVILTVNATPTTIYKTQTSTVTADLNHYMDNNGNIGTLTDHIPDVPVTFAVDANGNLDSLSGIISNGLNATTNFTATQIGSATVNATVDGFTVNQLITIMNRAPVAADDSASTYENTAKKIDVIANDVNPDGDAFSVTGVTQGVHGSVVINADGTVTYTPDNGFVGIDTFTYTITDANGGTSTATVTVNVLNHNPVAQNDSKIIDEDTVATGQVTATDADNDTLTYYKNNDPNHGSVTVNSNGTYTYTPEANYHGTDSFTVLVSDKNGGIDLATVFITVNSVDDAPTVGNYSVTTPEDTLTSGTVVGSDVDSTLTYYLGIQAIHGTAVVDSNGSWTYTPNSNYNGPDSFNVTVNDGLLTTTSTVFITVTPVNDAPMAVNDSASTDEDNSVDVDVLMNDTDVDTGDSKTINSFTQPGNGTTEIVGGKIRYTPNPNWHGNDTFTYTIHDGNGAVSNTATVTITVNPVNDAPTVGNYSVTIPEDNQAIGTVIGSDVEGDTLTYSKDTNPNHGSVTVDNHGTWIYTPNSNWYGTDSFTVLVSDGNGGTTVSTVTITINSVNDAPVAQNDTVNTKEDKSINISVLSNDSDADGDSLTVTNVTQPNHGTATINTGGTVTYTPNNNWHGLDSFTYTVSDGNGGTATATVNITVNQAVSDLYIKTTTSNSNPTIGERFILTYKLGNKGPDEAKNVTITFQLPEGLDFVNIHVDNGNCTYNETTRTVTWTLDSVPVGDPYLYLTVKKAGEGNYKIIPSITSDTYDLNSGDSGIITINVQTNNNKWNSNNENTVNAVSKTTIGLQDTGLPLNYLLLAVLIVLSGLVPKRK